MATYRLIQKGWETYTGELGQVQFRDGVTVDDYPQAYIDRIASTFRIENVDTGAAAGVTQRLIESKTIPAPVAAQFAKMTDEQIAAANAAAAGAAAKSANPTKFYTEAELGAVVDASGIAGLREIAAVYGVRAKSINDLITAVLKAQEVVKAAQAKAAAAAGTAIPGATTPAEAAAALAAAIPGHLVEKND